MTEDLSGGFLLRPNERLQISAGIQYVDAVTDSIDFTVFDRIDFPSFIMDMRGGIPSITMGGGAAYAENRSNYWWSAAMDHHDDNDADELAARIDIRSHFKSTRARGVRRSRAERRRAESRERDTVASHAGGSAAPVPGRPCARNGPSRRATDIPAGGGRKWHLPAARTGSSRA